jgi:cytochrome c peroxidase
MVLVGLLVGACSDEPPQLKATTREELGALMFDDPRMSEPAGQACSDCHGASAGFADPEDDRTSVGIIAGRFGPRNAQSAMYAGFVPPLHVDPATGQMAGGLFWDGRANTLEDQAAGPLMNPLEMNNPDKATVFNKVRSAYGRELKQIFGKDALKDADTAFAHVTEALGAFQRTSQFSPFTSKYDHVLAGTATLSDAEARGLAIFEDPARGNCASCHPNRPAASGAPPMFTTFTYANINVPRFNDSPFLHLPAALNPDGEGYVDPGLAKTTGNPAHQGMFRVPSLRNVARTTPYGHNGYFRRLDEMVAFSSPASTPLSRPEVEDLVAFLLTLTDAEVLAAHN